MAGYPPSSMPADTRIAGHKTVSDWLALRRKLLADTNDKQNWREAYDFFRLRIDTRFLKPIQSILSINERLGEGHSASALQCVLMEFLEALFQGKVYRPPISEEELASRSRRLRIDRELLAQHVQPDQYTASASLFVSFLTTRKPFAEDFSRQQASTFYRDIRCGLLHEAATKSRSKVWAEKEGDPTCLVDDVNNGIIVYRNAMQEALLSCINAYREQLLGSEAVQACFIRKMDDIAQVDRCSYFAYGSNLNRAQFRSRVEHIHSAVRVRLKDYAFRYNKKSDDSTSKANIEYSKESDVWGVCYEIDLCDFRRVNDVYEKGYNVTCVWTEKDNGAIIAETFISSSTATAPPSPDYVRTIVEGAREHKLPEDYITRCLEKK